MQSYIALVFLCFDMEHISRMQQTVNDQLFSDSLY